MTTYQRFVLLVLGVYISGLTYTSIELWRVTQTQDATIRALTATEASHTRQFEEMGKRLKNVEGFMGPLDTGICCLPNGKYGGEPVCWKDEHGQWGECFPPVKGAYK